MPSVENIPAIHPDRFVKLYEQMLKVNLPAAFDDFERVYRKYAEEDFSDTFIHNFVDTVFGRDFMPHLKSVGQFHSSINMLYHSFHFNKQKKVYRFEQGITEKLTRTNLSKVDTFFLRSPFRSIYISVPYNSELKITSNDGSLHTVEGFYVFHHELEESELSVGSNIPPGTKKFLRILAIGRSRGLDVNGLPDDCIYYLTFFFGDGDVFEAFEKELTRVIERDRDQIRKCFSFVLNALLYLTSSNPELELYKTRLEDISKIKNTAKVRKAQQRNDRLSTYPYYKVGQSILLGPAWEEGREGQEKREGTEHGPHKGFSHQWLVSGHWKHQPVGPQHSERKLIWIQPYVKGNELAEVINKDYVVR